MKPYYLLFNTLLYILLITNSKALCHQQDIQNRNKHFLFRFDLVLWGYTYQNQNNNLIQYSKTTLIEIIKWYERKFRQIALGYNQNLWLYQKRDSHSQIILNIYGKGRANGMSFCEPLPLPPELELFEFVCVVNISPAFAFVFTLLPGEDEINVIDSTCDPHDDVAALPIFSLIHILAVASFTLDPFDNNNTPVNNSRKEIVTPDHRIIALL